MDAFQILKEANLSSTYAVLRVTPDRKGRLMNHNEIKDTLMISDGKAEILKAQFEAASKKQNNNGSNWG